MGVKSAVCDDRWINRGGGGSPQADSRPLHCLAALPPGGSLALTRGQGDCQELSMGYAEIETPGEERWGWGGRALGMQVCGQRRPAD